MTETPKEPNPRLAWLVSRDIRTHEFTADPEKPRTHNHLGFGRWVAFVGKSVPAHEDSVRVWSNGDTEDDAIRRLAAGLQWELWQEEELPAKASAWVDVRLAVPVSYMPVIAWGTLEHESRPAAHQGFRGCRDWFSVRASQDARDIDGKAMLKGVTHWMPMPGAPIGAPIT